jgi:hypothetical protein
MRRGLCALCCRGGDCEAACEQPGSGVFHPVEWSVMLQRNRGEGSCMAVAFLVPWRLRPLIPIDAWSRLRFHDYKSVDCGWVVWIVDGCCGSTSVLLPLSSRVVVLLSRVRVELCGRVDIPIQPAGVVFIIIYCAQSGRYSSIFNIIGSSPA